MRPPRPHEVSEEDVGEATVVEDVPDPTGNQGTGVAGDGYTTAAQRSTG